ncbi:2-dehydropantoate 2-reductase [Paenibacillus larvae]
MVKIQIVGAGSLGLLFAGKLAASCTVELVTRRKVQAALLRKDGLQLKGQAPVYEGEHLRFVSFEEKKKGTGLQKPFDYQLLTVKQTAIQDELISFLAAWLSPHTTVVCFQNGIGHEERLLSGIPSSQLLLAVTAQGARKHSDTMVEHTGNGWTYIGGARKGNQQNQEKNIKRLQKILKKEGIELLVSNNIYEKIWNKLLINSVINPVTAILGVPNGDLLHSEPALKLMSSLYKEGLLCAKAERIPVQENMWEQILSVCQNTSSNLSSMLQDRLGARQTEIEYINGSLLRIGRKYGFHLPVNETIYQLIRALEPK